jgi:alkanesulfonate monooxygenase SsuD/methylene tetrahydromethanopterin reductase-like flavin-dependent oxidoreductase (luciferase family)
MVCFTIPVAELDVCGAARRRAWYGVGESNDFLWYIPNTVEPGHRGDDTTDGWGTLDYSVSLAEAAERHGWGGALIGTGWGRPDTFTVATAIAARTTAFRPLVAVRPGYWQLAHFASAAATLDRLSGGRLYVNVVTGVDDLAAYGDGEFDPARRYDRTREFLRLVRRRSGHDTGPRASTPTEMPVHGAMPVSATCLSSLVTGRPSAEAVRLPC